MLKQVQHDSGFDPLFCDAKPAREDGEVVYFEVGCLIFDVRDLILGGYLLFLFVQEVNIILNHFMRIQSKGLGIAL